MDDLKLISDEGLAKLRIQLLTALTHVAVFTPGSLQEEWTRCGKPNCHCACAGDPGHGPLYSVVRYADGKTRKQRLPAGLVDKVRQRIGAWNDFQAICARLADVNAEETRRLVLGSDAARFPWVGTQRAQVLTGETARLSRRASRGLRDEERPARGGRGRSL